MNLEHHRKAAKQLLRAVKAGAPPALARAERALGDRVGERFRLSDAQSVIAREHGHRSWPALRRAIVRDAQQRLAGAGQPRSETVVDTGLRYTPGDPVRVRVVRRAGRIAVTDDGVAIERAGRHTGWREAAARVGEEYVVNVSRREVVSLPVVPVGPSEREIVERIGRASVGLHHELLDLAPSLAAGDTVASAIASIVSAWDPWKTRSPGSSAATTRRA